MFARNQCENLYAILSCNILLDSDSSVLPTIIGGNEVVCRSKLFDGFAQVEDARIDFFAVWEFRKVGVKEFKFFSYYRFCYVM